MKVNSHLRNSVDSVESSKSRGLDKLGSQKKADENSSGLESLGSAKVNLSSKAQMMQKAKEIASKTDVDEAKVARLQKLIDGGNYKLDSASIAERLVDEHLMTGE